MRTKIAILIAIFSAAISLSANLADSLYTMGNEAYRNGKFMVAIEHYQAAIEAGASDWRVYFNLGNAFFREDEIGEAILNWERARHLRPRNENVLENLEFARTTKVDIVRKNEGGPSVTDVYENTFLGFFYDFLEKFSTFEFSNTIIVCSIIGTIFLALWLLVSGRFRKFFFWTSVIFWLLFITIGALFIIKQSNIWETDKAIVVQPGAEIRSASYSNSELLYTYQEGMEVAELEVRNGYSRVKLRNGEEGWMRSEYIQRVLPR